MAKSLSYIGQDESEGQVVRDVFPNDDDYYLAEATPFGKDDVAATSLKESSTGFNAVILDLTVASEGNSTNSKGQSSQRTQAPANYPANNNTSYPTQQSYYRYYN